MWGMIGLSPDWLSQQCEESDDKVAWDLDDAIVVGDIVTIATRSKKPVFNTSVNFDDMAQLRVLGIAQGDRTLYLCLVTAGDAEHVNPTTAVGRKQAHDYDVDPFYNGCDAVIISDLHTRSIAKKQRGRFCVKCTEYNEDVREDGYMCSTCRDNPYR